MATPHFGVAFAFFAKADRSGFEVSS